MKLSLRKKKRLHLIGIGSIVVLSIAIFLNIRYEVEVLSGTIDIVTYPLKKIISVTQNGMGDVAKYFEDVEHLNSMNEALLRENNQLSYENTILQQYRDENNELKKLLDMQQLYKDYPSLGANIIAKEPGNWYKVFNIDQGVGRINENDIILAGEGLVGHVVQVDPLTSQVISIIDDRSSVGVQVVRTDDVGILKGDIELSNQGLGKMELPSDSEVVKGDQIITSYLSEIYPPGIPVGIVEEVKSGETGLVQYAYVRPFVNFKNLQNVLVLSNKGEE